MKFRYLMINRIHTLLNHSFTYTDVLDEEFKEDAYVYTNEELIHYIKLISFISSATKQTSDIIDAFNSNDVKKLNESIMNTFRDKCYDLFEKFIKIENGMLFTFNGDSAISYYFNQKYTWICDNVYYIGQENIDLGTIFNWYIDIVFMEMKSANSIIDEIDFSFDVLTDSDVELLSFYRKVFLTFLI